MVRDCLLVASVAAVFVACGGRTDLGVPPSATPAAGVCAPVCVGKACGADDSCGGTCTCVCTPTPFPTVTSLSVDGSSPLDGPTGLDSVAVDGDNVLVATSIAFDYANAVMGDPNIDTTWSVTRASDALSLVGSIHAVLSFATAGEVGPGYVAAGYGHRGFLGWDSSDGCRFILLDANGVGSGDPVGVGGDVCGWLIATASGFVAIESPAPNAAPASLLRFDAAGTSVTRTPVAGPDGSALAAPGRAMVRFDDGTLLITWQSGQPQAIVGVHVREDGTPLAPPHSLFVTSTQAPASAYFAVTSLGTNGLAAWGNGTERTLALESTTEDGNVGDATALVPSWFAFLDVGSFSAGALVAWTEGVDPIDVSGALTVQSVMPTGEATSTPVTIAGYPNTSPLLVATPAGERVAFAGSYGNYPSEENGVFLVAPCAP